MWTIFKVFIVFVTMLLLFYALSSFAHKACGISAPQPGIKPTAPALEGSLNHWITREVPLLFISYPVCGVFLWQPGWNRKHLPSN